MATHQKRIVLDLDSTLESRLEWASAGQGVSVSEYCMQAIMRALESDNAVQPHSVTREWVDKTNALRNRIFQGRPTSDSVELIREARRERSEQVERAIRGD